MEQPNPTFAKISILDTGKFKQWKFRIQQYLQNEHYALWEVIEFGDPYEAPQDDSATGSASEGSAKKKERTVVVTTKDMQKRRNDVKARTTLLLALPGEQQLRFSKYKTAQELWAAILKTFSGNKATKKTKKNQLKQQYGNFKAEGSETLEQTFNRLQAIRNRSDLDTMSLDDLYNRLKVYEPEVQKKSESNSQNIAFISSAKNSSGKEKVNTASIPTASTQVSPASANVAAANISHDTACAYIASQSNGSQIKFEDINQIDEDNIKEMDIKWNMALLSMRADRGRRENLWEKDYHTRAPRSQDRGRRENFKQGSKVEESAPKALMVIDGEAPTEYALMAKSSSDNEVFDNSLCSKACLSQVEARLVEFKNQETKFCEKIRGLEFSVESKNNRIERLTNELEELKKEKEGSQRSDKNKEGLGYSVVPPSLAQVYSPPKKESWTGLPEFADDTITNYSRPSPSIESNSSDLQNSYSFVSENGESSESIMSKPMIKFVKVADSPTLIKTNKDKTVRKPSVKYAEMYRKTTKSSNVRGLFKENQQFELNLEFQEFPLASADESVLCHRRLGHLNFKTMNKLVRHNLVRVVTDDFSRFTWTFFLKTKDETSGILRNFIIEIENLKDLKVKIIRCDNGGEFRNKEMNDFCSRKGIKREFSNARTLKQNRVAEKRNMTLIEAARTMVLVNKSQNKTPYELFNGRTPAIRFLKLFGCQVMILNTLDYLGKFNAKGDEGYFIGYSMSSKTFRVFNKRTKKVEENLHVDFLENKLIEKGAGPNWLFDIDTLTNSMNYVPVMVAGTSSTNFSGTKDVASQDVKKDVSSLRYIALPNWFHEAHLESFTSNAQDACKADAPESSKNSNPTATSTNPPADQMETLTMETLIPTISSPVLTACLDDSSQPSSDTRLISKRVTSQDDTPSLDNILTLSNRFEDILGVTTNIQMEWKLI
uniref:Integrase catalytic domain-containing protein n=1 Tax=Tanacetum cinerariifolium TaxID=118510 RepID=A0A6L2LX84_TANCI|nr:hypothetical protein [Tanacetum cinerariifolium]